MNLLNLPQITGTLPRCSAQAVKEWETSLKVLAEIQAHVAAHPNQTTTPSHLVSKLNLIEVALSCELACPIASC